MIEEATLRDTLAEAVKTHTEAPDVVAEPVESAAPEETEAQRAERLRDEKGRFAKSEEKPDAKAEVQLPAQTVEAAAEQPKRVNRPASWKKDHWESFDKIAGENPALAEYINQRETEFQRGVSTYRNEVENARPLMEAIAPFMPDLQRHNIAPQQWISNLGNAHRMLVQGSPQDKLSMFQQMARDYGIPAQLAVQGQDGQWQLLGQQPPVQSPAPQPLDIQSEVQKVLLRERAVSDAQAMENDTQNYPHFSEVRNTMAQLLESGAAKDLQEAYSKATRLDDNIWQQEWEAKQAASQKAQIEAKAKEVARAKAASVSTKSATPAGEVTAGGDKSLRDTIAEATRAASGGGRV